MKSPKVSRIPLVLEKHITPAPTANSGFDIFEVVIEEYAEISEEALFGIALDSQRRLRAFRVITTGVGSLDFDAREAFTYLWQDFPKNVVFARVRPFGVLEPNIEIVNAYIRFDTEGKRVKVDVYDFLEITLAPEVSFISVMSGAIGAAIEEGIIHPNP